MIFPFAIIAALANRWRGGGWPLLPGETPEDKRTQVRRVVYAITIALLAMNPFVGAIAFLACLTGWGFPVSAAIGARRVQDWEPEAVVLDRLAKLLIGREYHSLRYGVVWLTLHGLFFGSMVALVMWSPWPLLWGCMGLAYYFAADWERGELVDGAIKGLGIGAALMQI